PPARLPPASTRPGRPPAAWLPPTAPPRPGLSGRRKSCSASSTWTRSCVPISPPAHRSLTDMSLSIANRIILGFGAITLALVLLAAYSLPPISEMRGETDAIVVRDVSVFRHVNDMAEATSRAGDAREDAVARYLTSALNRPARDATDPTAVWRQRAAASE